MTDCTGECPFIFLLAIMLPLEDVANQNVGLMIAQIVLMIYFLSYFVIAIRRVYQSSWLVTAWKSAAILFSYMIVVSVAIEGTVYFRIIAE